MFLVFCRTSLSDKLANGDSVTLRSPVVLLQGLRLCQEAWNPGGPWDRQGAQAALWGRPPGVKSQSLCTLFYLCPVFCFCLVYKLSEVLMCGTIFKTCMYISSGFPVTAFPFFVSSSFVSGVVHVLILWFSVFLLDDNVDYGNDYNYRLLCIILLIIIMKPVFIYHYNCAYNFDNWH